MDTKIWEFSLHFPRELLCYFEDLKNNLKNLLKNEKNCISLSVCNGEYVLMIAISHEMYNKYILTIKEHIAKVILIYYKPKSIINSIKNFNLSHHDNVILIQILSSIDVAEDKTEIFKHLSLIDELYLDSFVNFKLNNLTKKWKEVANLINDNSFFLLDEKIKKELMQFLMEGIVSKTDCIKLCQNGAQIDCKIGTNEIRCEKLYYSIFDYDSTLFAVINNSPKKIEVENYKSFDVSFIQNLSDLFGSRLHLIE